MSESIKVNYASSDELQLIPGDDEKMKRAIS